MTQIAAGSTVYTFQDATEYLLDGQDQVRNLRNQRDTRRAILQAYRELPQKHTWSFFQRQTLLQTVAAYSTGTIAVDVTGGSSERMVTLTSGTWPSWAAQGRIIIDSVHYEVNSRVSSTVITLQAGSCPADDVTAGTTYELYQNAYPLPVGFRRLMRCFDTAQRIELPQVLPTQQHWSLQSEWISPSTPWECTVRGSDDYYGQFSLVFSPPPVDAITYDLFYNAQPQPLTVDVYNTGTIAISGATVTGAGTTFPANCAGCILRVSGNTQPPTSLVGDLSVDNPFTEQLVIKSRDSATQLTLESSGTSVSGKGYTISSPLDIDQGAMYTAFLRMAEAEYSRLKQQGGPNGWQAFLPPVRQAILEAIESDARLGGRVRTMYSNPMRYGSVSGEGE